MFIISCCAERYGRLTFPGKKFSCKALETENSGLVLMIGPTSWNWPGRKDFFFTDKTLWNDDKGRDAHVSGLL